MRYIKNYKEIFESKIQSDLYNEITFGDYLAELENVSNLDDNVFIELQNYFKSFAFDIEYENNLEYAAISQKVKTLLTVFFLFDKKKFEITIGEMEDEYFIVIIRQEYVAKNYICDGLDGLFDLFNKVLINKDYLNWVRREY